MATLLPPQQYDHVPSVPVIEQVLSASEVQRICALGGWEVTGQNWQGAPFLGCQVFIVRKSDGKRFCSIVRIDDAAVARHERAHCNGWGWDHKGGW